MKPLELHFALKLRRLPESHHPALLRYLRRLLHASHNGKPARQFYIVNPTGGIDPL